MTRGRIKAVAWIAGSFLAATAAGAWGFFEATKRAWIHYNDYDIRSEGTLRVGDWAPDLALANADGSGEMRLADLFAEKPLVLVFGSYT